MHNRLVRRRDLIKYLALVGTGGLVSLGGERIGEERGLELARNAFGTIWSEQANSFIIWTDAGNVYARNCTTGKVDYSGTQATSVIQDAINALTGGGTIFLKNGRYTVSSTIPDADVSDLVMLVGEGPGTKIIPTTSGFDAIDVDQIMVRDLTFQDMNLVECDSTLDQKALNSMLPSVPITWHYGPGIELKLMGNYVRMRTTRPGLYPAITTCVGYTKMFGNVANAKMTIKAKIKSHENSSFFPLFTEPYKGEYDDFCGFKYDSVSNKVEMNTRREGNQTQDVAALDPTIEHTYEIRYLGGTSPSVDYYIDGNLETTHTSNVPNPPRVFEACEPAGVAMSIYLKRPFIFLQELLPST
jgi:hypothetical protein